MRNYDIFRRIALFVIVLCFVVSPFTLAPSAFALTVTTVDSAGDVGRYTAIAMGTDGFPRISYWDTTNSDLKFVQCLDVACTSIVSTVVDGIGNTGQASSLVIASDGFARISYYDISNGDLRLAQCTNASCSTNILTTVDSHPIESIGSMSSIAMGADGFPRIAYYDAGAGDLKFAQCTNASCSTKSLFTIDSTGNSGRTPSLALGSDGFARISYEYSTNGDLKFVQCTNANCSTNIITSVDTVNNVANYTSLALGSDGFARISYDDFTTGNLMLVQCTNASCSTNTKNVVAGPTQFGIYPSLALGTDGNPRISFYDQINEDLIYVICSTANCSAKTSVTIDSTGSVSSMSSLVLSGSLPRFSYYDFTNGDLKVAVCINNVCDNTPPTPDSPTSTSLRTNTLSRSQTSTASNHTIGYTTSGGVSAGETMTITFPSGFTIPGALDHTDIDVSYGPTTGLENDLTLGVSASGSTWGASISGQVITITSGAGTIPTSSRVIIKIGSHTSVGSVGDQQVTNPSTAGSYILTIGGTFNDNGDIAVAITDTDVVTVTATTPPIYYF